jgi:hypothetical protein
LSGHGCFAQPVDKKILTSVGSLLEKDNLSLPNTLEVTIRPAEPLGGAPTFAARSWDSVEIAKNFLKNYPRAAARGRNCVKD